MASLAFAVLGLAASATMPLSAHAQAPDTDTGIDGRVQTVALEGGSASDATAPPIQQQNPWLSDAAFAGLLTALAGLDRHGLEPAQYGLTQLVQLRNQPARRGRLATKAWLKAASDLSDGRGGQQDREPDEASAQAPGPQDLQAILAGALASGNVAGSFDRLAPSHPEYRALVAELERLRSGAAREETVISEGRLLQFGTIDARVPVLRQRLAELGYYTAMPDSIVFDLGLSETVERFQRDQGLEADGIVGPATLSILNLTHTAKIDRLRVNLERWRRLPRSLGQRHVRVNIAGFEVNAFDGGVRVQTHRAIVGRLERQTPTFSDKIEYIVFNPWWETPAKLARKDELPLFRRDPEAVQRLGFQVLDRTTGLPVDATAIDWNEVPASPFPYRLRQAPGPLNALGQVKILFPNRHAVYLHDTPKRSLFHRTTRTFSSGCIRVQDVLDLVEWLLDGSEVWSRQQMQAAIDAKKEKWVTLPEPVPVHIFYQTVVVEGDGQIRYLPDPYDRDPKAIRALDAPLAVAWTDS